MMFRSNIASRSLVCLIIVTVIALTGCKTADNEKSRTTANGSSVEPEKGRATTNLDFVLEGPFAIQTHLDGQPHKIKILLPNARDHFNPGFDADLNQSLLCQGVYSVDLPKHGDGSMKSIATTAIDGPIQIDTVDIASVPESRVYIGITIDSPDEVVPLAPTTATIKGPNGSGEENVYASTTLLRYTNMDSGAISVRKLTGDPTVCKVTPKFFDLPIPWKTVTVSYPYTPSFVQLGSEIRLSLSMVPSVKDDVSHDHASASYQAIAKMLGVNRTVVFPGTRGMHAGPHNDCRAPQILVQPPRASGN